MYEEFALIYDALMEEFPYEDYKENLLEFISPAGRVMDLGCGTGNLTKLFFERGADVTGIDNSSSMLSLAKRKLPRVNFLQAKLEEVNLGKFDQIYACVDVLNYQIEDEKQEEFLKAIGRHLKGHFFFDIRNPEALLKEVADKTFYYEDELGDLIWINEKEGRLIDQDIIIYWKEEDVYIKTMENHRQRIWYEKEIEDLLVKVGFRLDKKRVTKERIFYLCSLTD